MDYTVITEAVDWTLVLGGVGVIAAALAVVKVGTRGARILLAFLGR